MKNCDGRTFVQPTLAVVVAVLSMGALVVTAGCGGGTSAGAEASGVLTLDGSPLAGAGIAFYPTSDTGSGAFAKCDDNGEFTVKTAGSVSGLAPGEYVVVIEGADDLDEEEGITEVTIGGKVIPEKYLSEKTSDIKISVSESEENELEIKLSSS